MDLNWTSGRRNLILTLVNTIVVPIAAEQGIYSIPQAARLLGINDARLRSWMTPSIVRTRRGRRERMPLWRPHLPVVGGRVALTFLDLMEVRLIKRLVDQEKPMRLSRIREALIHYREENSDPWPLLNQRLFTDGCYLYRISVDESGVPLLNLNRWQYCFETVVAPTLLSIDLGDNGLPERWWPKGRTTPIMLDPTVAFGDPVVAEKRVPTATLADAVAAEGSVERVARWYDLPEEDVKAALAFEADLAARRLAA